VLVDEPMAIKLTLLAVALGSCLTSVEYLYALSRDGLGSRSLFAWEICGCRQGWLFRGLPAQLMNWCFQPSPFAALMIVRIAGCVALVALTDRCILAALSLGLTLLAGLLSIRHEHGKDGADQMMIILSTGVFAYLVFDPESPWRWTGIIFISGQAALAYFVSGAAKLISKEWRTGRALPNVLTTTIYGSPKVGKTIRQWPVACMVLTWWVMVWEVSFPLLLISPPQYRWMWLAAGFSFHTGSAVLMGLNTFLIAFVGTYPAMLLTAELLRHH
jgi:hypothetical protein